MELNDLIKTADDRQMLYVATFDGVMRFESVRDSIREVKRCLLNAADVGLACENPSCDCVDKWFAASTFMNPDGKVVRVEIIECALVRARHDQMEVRA